MTLLFLKHISFNFFSIYYYKKEAFLTSAFSTTHKSRHSRWSGKKVVLKSFTYFKNTCVEIFFNKVTGLECATLLKKRLWHRGFPVIFANILRAPIQRTPRSDWFCVDNYAVCWKHWNKGENCYHIGYYFCKVVSKKSLFLTRYRILW